MVQMKNMANLFNGGGGSGGGWWGFNFLAICDQVGRQILALVGCFLFVMILFIHKSSWSKLRDT